MDTGGAVGFWILRHRAWETRRQGVKESKDSGAPAGGKMMMRLGSGLRIRDTGYQD